MEVICKKTIPQITLLKSEKGLDAWKLSVGDVFKFYGMEKIVSQAGARPRKRAFRDRGHAAFLLGLLSASVSPVANRLVKTGWDFGNSQQEPEDLYDHVLRLMETIMAFPASDP
ncbi:hypothetical protein NKR19_g7933 [Coniochaeta hoffmannii]|uniref:Uncharacterized protein n=1 Tax=Coniochaeta hoffmannii TaxID=91930 RepID=A0AA38REQ5_9PEZI|nr:hypothetical protein NKR19_g7933 [Coniochaeta hoffmannii]